MRAAARTIAAMLAASAASGAAAMPSAQEIFCADLARVLETARIGGDFIDLERSRAAPPALGFARGCRAAGDTRRHYWVCHQQFAPESMGVEALAGRVAACLPEAVRAKPGMYREAVFTLPYARIRVSEHGGPGGHVGRIAELLVEATGPRAQD